MQIDRAGLSVSEKMVFYLRGPELGINMRLFFTQQTAVFGFDPNDPVHCNQLTHRIAIWLNENPPHLNPLPQNGERQIPALPTVFLNSLYISGAIEISLQCDKV